ncbi:MAG: hypothetical protein PQJ59_01060 [Spirochaetales bacterium]|nr:hypothetical protein [Spirochaetales bacterium]
MIKKYIVSLLFFAAVLPLCAASDEEVLAGTEGVLTVLDLVVSDCDKPVEGLELDMDLRYGLIGLSMENMSVSSLLSERELGKDISAEELPFATVSGHMSLVGSNISVDVQLAEGPVHHLILKVDGGEVSLFKADDMDCLFLAENQELLDMIAYNKDYFIRYFL